MSMIEPDRLRFVSLRGPRGGPVSSPPSTRSCRGPDTAMTTRAKFRQTVSVVEDGLGASPVTGAAITGVVAQRWHHASPATQNRHLATVRSFARGWQRTRPAGCRW